MTDLYPLTQEQRAKDLGRLRRWLRTLVSAPHNYLILDSETTGLKDCEIVELAVIDLEGTPLLNQRFKPKGEISKGASHCHGISLDDLGGCPTFPELFPLVLEIIDSKELIIYNAEFDLSAIASSLKHWGIPYELNLKYHCLMRRYATFVGDWSQKHNSYIWKRLKGNHTALGDCYRALELIREMSSTLLPDKGADKAFKPVVAAPYHSHYFPYSVMGDAWEIPF